MRLPSLFTAAYYYVRSHWLELRPWAELAEEEGLKGKSLAIVGNATSARELESGGRLDAFDLVLRIDSGVSARSSDHQGRCDLFLSAFDAEGLADDSLHHTAPYLISTIPANFEELPDWGLPGCGGVAIARTLLAWKRPRAYVPEAQVYGEWFARLGGAPSREATTLLFALGELGQLWRSAYVTGIRLSTTGGSTARREERYLLRQLIAGPRAPAKLKLDPALNHDLFFDDARCVA